MLGKTDDRMHISLPPLDEVANRVAAPSVLLHSEGGIKTHQTDGIVVSTGGAVTRPGMVGCKNP